MYVLDMRKKQEKGVVFMFFTKKKDKFTTMRDELRRYYLNKQIDTCNHIQDDFTESALSRLRNGTHFDDVRLRRVQADADQILQSTLRQLDNLDKMSNGEIGQLYYEVFRRRRPLG